MDLLSVAEATRVIENHRHAETIGRVDRILIPFRPARLYDGRDAGLSGLLDAVAEREEGVRGHGASGQGMAGPPRLV